jgi:hypothetical protein
MGRIGRSSTAYVLAHVGFAVVSVVPRTLINARGSSACVQKSQLYEWLTRKLCKSHDGNGCGIPVGRVGTTMKSEIERRRYRRAVKMLGRLVFTTLGPLTLSLLFAAYPPSVHAVTIIAIGTPGTPGVDGAIGTNGEPAGDAPATTPPNNDATNTANATGGAGGNGGSSAVIGAPGPFFP